MARRTIVLTTALGTLAFFATLAPAQSTYRLPESRPPVETKAGRTLTDDDLRTMLDDMGYQAEQQKLDTGEIVYWFDVTHEKVNYRVRACVCGRKVWLTTFMAQLTPDDKAQRQALQRILEQNGVTVSKFEIWNGGKDLVLTRSLDNRAVTAQDLRLELAGFMADVKDGKQTWTAVNGSGVTRMPAPEVKPTKAPARTEPKAEDMRFAPAGGRFRIRMPGKPDAQTIEINSEHGPATLNLYRTANEKEETCHVAGYVDIPEGEARDATDAEKVNQVCQGIVEGAKGKVVSNKAIKVAGFPGRDVTVETDAGVFRARVIIVDQRVYEMIVFQGKDRMNPEAAQEFFDSFQLTR